MEPEPPSDGGFLRLHPASLLFAAGESAKRFLVPGLLVLLLSRGEAYDVGLMVLFVPGIVTAFARWTSFSYRLGADELVIREGIFERNERHIPYARIQNVDLVQNPLHRLLRVADVRIETASGSKAEATIRVLSLEAIDALRARILPGRAEAAPTEPPPALLALRPRDLVVVGLASNRGLALVAAALGALWQIDRFGGEERLRALAERLPATTLPADLGPFAASFLLLAVLGVAALAFKALSVVWALVRFHGFTLRLRDEDLRAEHGLLTLISATIPRHRIQHLAVASTPVLRAFGRASVQVETAGSRAEEGEGGSARLWLAPAIAVRRVGDFVGAILPGVDLARLVWRPLAPRAAARMARRRAIEVALLSALSAPWLGVWSLAIFAAGVAAGWLHARAWVARAGWAVSDDSIAWRAGWWRREISIVRFSKIQAVELHASPFDRRAGMASLGVDTAGRGRVGRMRLRYLRGIEATALADRLASEAASRAFRW